jgi:hypothetical protein
VIDPKRLIASMACLLCVACGPPKEALELADVTAKNLTKLGREMSMAGEDIRRANEMRAATSADASRRAFVEEAELAAETRRLAFSGDEQLVKLFEAIRESVRADDRRRAELATAAARERTALLESLKRIETPAAKLVPVAESLGKLSADESWMERAKRLAEFVSEVGEDVKKAREAAKTEAK